MPSYDNMIPQPTDILSDSQDDLLQNFLVLATAFAVNHGPYNENAPFPQGSHTEVTLPNNVAPDPTPIATANMWSAQSPYTMTTELNWQRENNGTIVEWTGALNGIDGWTRLPSGILLKWGLDLTTSLGPTTVTFPAAGTIPIFNAVFAVIVSVEDVGNINAVTTVGGTVSFIANTYTANTGARVATTIYYLAIGN